MLSNILAATSIVLAATLVSAQTSSECDPIKTSNCKPDPALGGTIDIDFRNGASNFFTAAQGTEITYDKTNGAVFTIHQASDAPTIVSNKYIFYGKVDVVVRASQGVGVVTSFVLLSDDLDEIDWEWLGGDTTQAQTNYFSKGCTATYNRGGFSAVDNPQRNFDTYTIDWTPTQLTWSINGKVLRTLSAAGTAGCDGYPQTPMQIKLGTWVAGGPNSPPGTVQWAGGYTDFSKGPFIGYYQSIKITDYSNGVAGATEYVYDDQSGTSASIKVISGGGSASGTTPSNSASSSVSAHASGIRSMKAPMWSGVAGASGSASGPTTQPGAKPSDSAVYTNSTTTGGGGAFSGPSVTAPSTQGATTTATSAGTSVADMPAFSVAAVALLGASFVVGLAL